MSSCNMAFVPDVLRTIRNYTSFFQGSIFRLFGSNEAELKLFPFASPIFNEVAPFPDSHTQLYFKMLYVQKASSFLKIYYIFTSFNMAFRPQIGNSVDTL